MSTMRHTRRTVLDRTRREFRALDGFVARLSPRDWARPVPRPPTRDPWTVKDALAHIVYWKEHTARVIRGERRPPEMRGLDVNQINRLVYERWRGRRPNDVLAWHRTVHAEVLETLARTPEEWFRSRDRGPRWPADLDGHSAAHRARDIEAALAAGPGTSGDGTAPAAAAGASARRAKPRSARAPGATPRARRVKRRASSRS